MELDLNKTLVRSKEEYKEVCKKHRSYFGDPSSYPFILAHNTVEKLGDSYNWIFVYLDEFVTT